MSDSETVPSLVDIRSRELPNIGESNELLDLKHRELLDHEKIVASIKPRKCVCVKDVKHKIIYK